MATKARFLTAADNTRPYKCHRYDVFDPKVARSITLFGQTPLNAWIALEADPAVVSYCERPLLIPDIKPKRVVDFWVRFPQSRGVVGAAPLWNAGWPGGSG